MNEQIIWGKLRELIANQIGFQIRPQDLGYFKPKALSRVKKCKLKSISEYYQLLVETESIEHQKRHRAQKEWQALANIVTNGESFFFRDPGQLNLLKKTILPQIIEQKLAAKANNKLSVLTLKVWSAGCSTGEEVYSLAILIRELLPDLTQWQIVILGTDINQDFIDTARQGIYGQWSFRQVDPLIKSKYFTSQGAKWQVKPQIKRMVNFYCDNLLEVDRISHCTYDIDIVICRNVFIYFSSNSIKKAIQKFSRTLRVGGYLIAGHTELQNIELSNFQSTNFAASTVHQYLGIQLPEISESTISEVEVTKEAPRQLQNTPQELSPSKSPSIDITLTEANAQKTSNLQKYSPKVKSDRSSSNQNIHQQFQAISKLLDSGKYEQVITEAEKMLSSEIKTSETYLLLARSYFAQNKLEQAIDNCNLILKQDPIAIQPLFLLAQIATKQQNYSQGKNLFKRVLYLDPFVIDAYIELGKIYTQEQNYKRALKMYLIAKELSDTSTEVNVSTATKQKIRTLLNQLKLKNITS